MYMYINTIHAIHHSHVNQLFGPLEHNVYARPNLQEVAHPSKP